jgi:hypothetical protein
MKDSAEEMLAKQEQTPTVFHASMRDGAMGGIAVLANALRGDERWQSGNT